MSMQITEAFVQQFRNNVFHLAQQKGSRLRGAVRNETLKGKQGFFERIGPVEVVQRVSRHDDTPQIDTPHSRRRVTMADWRWADLVDDEDKLRTLIDPINDYVQAAMMSLGRKMDDIVISGIRGTAYSGETGSTSVDLANSNKLLAYADSAVGTPTNLNVDTLRRIKQYFDASDVDESIPRYIALTSSQLRNLLGETAVTSSDFNSVKALVNGQMNTFMGFNFIRIERLPTADYTYNASTGAIANSGSTLSSGRAVLAWAKDGVVMAVGNDMSARISERADKNYSMQAYASMSIGATRLEEAKVCEIGCKET